VKIYTKTGDKGETSLLGGKRVRKDDLQLMTYGEVDELNSYIGLLVSYLDSDELKPLLKIVQNNLFNLGSLLASNPSDWEQYKLKQINESLISDLEIEIDRMNESLAPLKNFILPGGSKKGSYAHICRVVCRRVERSLCHFHDHKFKIDHSVQFLNRLSDYFFTLARYLNKKDECEEVLWTN